MKKISSQKGFTLIELLVVVAIIGLLAATILASLGTARKRAKSARVQSEVSSMRAAAELVYSENGSYAGMFSGGAAAQSAGLTNLYADMPVGALTSCNSGDTTWACATTLPDQSGYFCADSNGFSGKAASLAIGASDDFKCTPGGGGITVSPDCTGVANGAPDINGIICPHS